MSRAVSTAVGVLLLTAVTIVIAGAVGAFALEMTVGAEPVAPHRISASVDAAYGRVFLVHESGPTLDVRDIDIRILVDGTPLRHQPPVPYYSEPGFHRFPRGPFNPMADPRWEIGERAMVNATDGNRAVIANGTVLRVEIYRGDLQIARATAPIR